MQHKVIKAATTATDQGQFTAIAAAYSVDRGNEQIERGAFEKTIARWQASNKQIPLHWDHSGNPEDIIGSVDPKAMREADEGLYVKGQLDLENSEVAREAWRLMKQNVVALSFGYLVNEDSVDADGVKHLKAIDLFELTITPAPMNPDTRFLNLKSAKRELAREFVAEIKDLREEAKERSDLLQEALEGKDEETEALRKDADNLAFNLATEGIAEVEQKPAPVEPTPEPETKAKDVEKPPGTPDPQPKQTAATGAFTITGQTPPGAVVTGGIVPPITTVTTDTTLIKDGDDQVPEDQRSKTPATKSPEEAKSPAQDPLRKASDRLAFELAAGGIKRAEPPKVKAEPTEDLPSMEALRRDCERLMLETLIGE